MKLYHAGKEEIRELDIYRGRKMLTLDRASI